MKNLNYFVLFFLLIDFNRFIRNFQLFIKIKFLLLKFQYKNIIKIFLKII